MSKKAKPQPIAVMFESRNKKNEVVSQSLGSNPAKDVGEDPLSHAAIGQTDFIPYHTFNHLPIKNNSKHYYYYEQF